MYAVANYGSELEAAAACALQKFLSRVSLGISPWVQAFKASFYINLYQNFAEFHVRLSICLSVCPHFCVRLSTCFSVCPYIHICLSICLSVCPCSFVHCYFEANLFQCPNTQRPRKPGAVGGQLCEYF